MPNVVKRHLIPSEVHDLLHKSGHRHLYTREGTAVGTIKRKRKSVGDELRRGEIRESSGRKGGVGLWGFSGAGHVVSEEAPITYHAVFSIAPSASPAPSRNDTTHHYAATIASPAWGNPDCPCFPTSVCVCSAGGCCYCHGRRRVARREHKEPEARKLGDAGPPERLLQEGCVVRG